MNLQQFTAAAATALVLILLGSVRGLLNYVVESATHLTDEFVLLLGGSPVRKPRAPEPGFAGSAYLGWDRAHSALRLRISGAIIRSEPLTSPSLRK
jgi:hypothetical protein